MSISSPWLPLVCFVGIAVGLAVGSIWLGKRILPPPTPGVDHNGMLAPFLGVVGLLYGAMLGFTVISTWEQFASTQVIVSAEASALTTMYRQTAAMPDDERAQLQPLLRQYAHAVEGPERNLQGSDQARSAITHMYRVVGAQPSMPPNLINAQFLSQLGTLASDRNERIIGTRPRIPGLLWAALIFGGVVVVTFSGFLRMESTVGHLVVSCAIAALLGVLICLVFVLDYSYSTDSDITSARFQHALQIFDAVDRGN